jgi:hypothetical protein
MAQVATLAERVAELLYTGGMPMDILGLLARIEQASAAVWEIGQLTMLGAERLKVQELCVNVQVMISRIRSMLERNGVENGQCEDG